MTHKKKTIAPNETCFYCGLPIPNPKVNKYFHDDSCRQMYWYWQAEPIKKNSAYLLLGELRGKQLIGAETALFLNSLTPSALVSVLQALGYRWRNNVWVNRW